MALLNKLFKKKDQAQKPQAASKKKTDKKSVIKKIIEKKISQKDKRRLTKVYGILKEPRITEKATALAETGKYVFKVALKANKIEIKRAVEDLYSVQVKKVNVVKVQGKKRRLGRSEGWKGGLKKGFKKAIVTLVKGESIEVMPR